MKFYKLFSVLIFGIMLLGIVIEASADSPTLVITPSPSKGDFGLRRVQAANIVLDSSTAQVTRRGLTPDDNDLSSNLLPNELFNQEINAASLQTIKIEDFESNFPNDWQFFDSNGPTGGEQLWSDVPCLARTGFSSGWPAGPDGLNGVNPCAGADYPNLARSWLIYGPFSLANAQSGNFSYYFRMVSEFCPPNIETCDFFFVGVSTDQAQNFSGWIYGGGWTNGPYNNGYFFDTLDFTQIPSGTVTVNVTGQPQVWIGFFFKSDESVTAQGPFIDDVSVTFEPLVTIKSVFLPVIIKNPPPVIPKTNLSVQNNTSGSATYTIKQPKLDGSIIPNISCNIPQGAKVFCGTFDQGRYQVRSASPCGVGEGARTFPAGNYDLDPPLHCINK